MKNVRQWLETIADEEIREKAFRNMYTANEAYEPTTLAQAIMSAFRWCNSPEGFNYWDKIYGIALLEKLEVHL